jgi:hypothetical protein
LRRLSTRQAAPPGHTVAARVWDDFRKVNRYDHAT